MSCRELARIQVRVRQVRVPVLAGRRVGNRGCTDARTSNLLVLSFSAGSPLASEHLQFRFQDSQTRPHTCFSQLDWRWLPREPLAAEKASAGPRESNLHTQPVQVQTSRSILVQVPTYHSTNRSIPSVLGAGIQGTFPTNAQLAADGQGVRIHQWRPEETKMERYSHLFVRVLVDGCLRLRCRPHIIVPNSRVLFGPPNLQTDDNKSPQPTMTLRALLVGLWASGSKISSDGAAVLSCRTP